MANLNKVVYLSEEQKNTLFTTGSVTANGTTVTYNPNDIYITPPAYDAVPTANSSNLITSGAVYSAISGLSGAMHFRGTTTTAIADGSTTNPITINGNDYTAAAGDVVLREVTAGDVFEYVWIDILSKTHHTEIIQHLLVCLLGIFIKVSLMVLGFPF